MKSSTRKAMLVALPIAFIGAILVWRSGQVIETDTGAVAAIGRDSDSLGGRPGLPLSSDRPDTAIASQPESAESVLSVASGRPGALESVAEASLLGPNGSWNGQSMADALMSDGFAEWMASLRQGARSKASASEQERDYGDAMRLEASRIDGRLKGVGCGDSVCAMEVETAATPEVFSTWLRDVFSESGLPAGSLMTYPILGSGTPNRYRVVFVTSAGSQAVTVPISVPAAKP
jgi:hypothetical protein